MAARARLIDVAEAAGVSRVAVGKVLLDTGGERVRVAEGTARKIRAAAQRLGYRPNITAQQLRGRPSQLISVVMSVGAPAVELDRLVQLEKLACAAGFQLAVSATPDGDPLEGVQRAVDSMAARGVDGFIFLTPDADIYVKGLPDVHGIPAVFNGVGDVFASSPTVSMDMEMGGRLSAEHVLKRGRKRIVTAHIGPNVFSEGRLRGVRAAVAKRGRGAALVESHLVDPSPSCQRLSVEACRAIVRDLVLDNKADALLTENDYWAAAFLVALKREGVRVPDDVAVVGYNNVEVSVLTDPALTTIEEHNDRIAGGLLEMLVERIETDRPIRARCTVVKPSLIVREST